MKTVFCILVFTLFSTILNAQDGRVSYYCGPAEVNAMALEGGYLWTGSNTGLFKININSGKLESFQTVSSGILTNKITSIAVDRKGAKWIGHPDGISFYDGSAWKTYKISDFIQSDSYINQVLSFAFDKDNTAWMGTYRGLVRFDGNQWTLYSPVPAGNYFSVSSIAVDNSGIMWLATSRGLEKFDGTNWTLIDTTKGAIDTEGINFLAIDSKGTKWFSSYARILYKYDGEKMVSYKMPPADSTTYYSSVNSVSVDKNDVVWIGTDVLISFDGQSWNSYNQKNNKLPGTHVTCAVSDNSGAIWAGTNENPARLTGGSFTVFDLSNSGLPNNHVGKIVSDNEGNIWIISVGYLSLFKNGFWRNFNAENSGLPPVAITDIAFDSRNNAWIGTWNGLVMYDGDRTWTVYNSKNSGLLDNRVEALAFDSKGVLWIASSEGLARFDGHNWKFYNRYNSGFSGNPMSISVDMEDIKWIGVGGGVLKFDDKSWKAYSLGLVPSVVVDKNNTKWFGTSGFVKYDNTNWDSYQADYMVNSIIPISQTSLLFASNWGLGQFDVSNGSVNWCPINSKLLNNYLNTIFLDKDNNLWIGSDGGGIAVYNEKGITSGVTIGLLLQNFPNPFNSSTTIYYSVPSAGTTILKVYDILGREVTTLVDEFKTPGTYKINFNAGNLSGGVYVYSVTSGGKRESRKLVLLK
ncbi:MAG TPA: two-component regulator propeller domain-containing protein [Ignavibacteriales bacterium]|nr:two-component regulator propeller domain-containing protein [Ignavibacteriales bacterium]